jgi:hypothetical protein
MDQKVQLLKPLNLREVYTNHVAENKFMMFKDLASGEQQNNSESKPVMMLYSALQYIEKCKQTVLSRRSHTLGESVDEHLLREMKG